MLTIISPNRPPPKSPSISAINLEKVYEKALKNGLYIPKTDFDRLSKIASKVLVPNDEKSRLNAGAKVDNNE